MRAIRLTWPSIRSTFADSLRESPLVPLQRIWNRRRLALGTSMTQVCAGGTTNPRVTAELVWFMSVSVQEVVAAQPVEVGARVAVRVVAVVEVWERVAAVRMVGARVAVHAAEVVEPGERVAAVL